MEVCGGQTHAIVRLGLDQLELHRFTLPGIDSYAELLSYVPEPSIFHVGHDPGRWVQVARRMEEAGASAIELTIYAIPTDPDLSSAVMEPQVEEIVREAMPGAPLEA